MFWSVRRRADGQVITGDWDLGWGTGKMNGEILPISPQVADSGGELVSAAFGPDDRAIMRLRSPQKVDIF